MTQLEAFALTLAIEAVVAALLARPFAKPWQRMSLSAVAASCVTHPILWAIYYDVYAVTQWATTPLLEAAVIVAEAPAYRLIGRARWTEALLLSLLVNAASWWAGELIYALR